MEEKKEVNKARLITGLVMALLGFFLITFDGGDLLWNLYAKIVPSATQPDNWSSIMNIVGWVATGLGLFFAWSGKK